MNTEPFEMMRTDKRFDSMNLGDVEIYDLDNNGIYQGMGKTLNLSIGGLLFEIYEEIPVQLNYRVHFIISLHDASEMVELKGIIRWLHYHDGKIKIGVKFIPLTKKTTEKLRNFLSSLRK